MADAADVEEQKKSVLPYMQRAQEIQNADPKVAYYCRLYGVEQALKIERRTKEINGLLAAAMSHMEKDKPTLRLNSENDSIHCEGFALRIFKNAEKVDLSGRADANTAKAYYAASFFIEILNQFGPLDNELLEKQRYAAWRAFDIRKALREGRQPTPPEAKQPPSAEGASGSFSNLPPAYEGAYSSSFMQEPAQSHAAATAAAEGSTLPRAYDESYSASFQQPSHAPAPPGPSGSSYASAVAAPPPDHSAVPQYQEQGQVRAPPVAGPSAGGAVLQRYGPGSRVLCMESDEGSGAEQGTVGQVLYPDGATSMELRYRVGLKDHFVNALDGQLAPNPEELQPIYFVEDGFASPPCEATMLLVNDINWPPTYLISIKGGKEREATAQQVWLSLPGTYAAVTPQQQQQPFPTGASPGTTYPSATSQASSLSGASSSSSLPTPPAHAAPPPYQQPYYPQPYAPAPPPAHSAPPPPQPVHSFAAPPPAQAYAPPAPQAYVSPPPGFKPSLAQVNDAQKACRTAISALNFEDIASAVKCLHEALKQLQPQ